MKRICRKSKIVKKLSSVKTSVGEIPFILKLSPNRRTMVISVNSQADVCVSAPLFVPERNVHVFIKEKADWINKRLKEANHQKSILDRKQYKDGEKFLFLGKKYPLKIEQQAIKRSKLKFTGAEWVAQIPSHLLPQEKQSEIAKKMTAWYKAEAKEILGGRVFHYSRILGKEPLRIEVKAHKRIWGNCNPNSKTININWQVILSPLDVVDYVVVHELCHLWIPNHSQKFWKKVEEILPNYKIQKLWLRNNCLDLLLPGQN